MLFKDYERLMSFLMQVVSDNNYAMLDNIDGEEYNLTTRELNGYWDFFEGLYDIFEENIDTDDLRILSFFTFVFMAYDGSETNDLFGYIQYLSENKDKYPKLYKSFDNGVIAKNVNNLKTNFFLHYDDDEYKQLLEFLTPKFSYELFIKYGSNQCRKNYLNAVLNSVFYKDDNILMNDKKREEYFSIFFSDRFVVDFTIDFLSETVFEDGTVWLYDRIMDYLGEYSRSYVHDDDTHMFWQYNIYRIFDTVEDIIAQQQSDDEQEEEEERDYHETAHLFDDDMTSFNGINDIALSINKTEIQNRIEKKLYKGSERVKGLIYDDTLQFYLQNLRNSTKQYQVVDGRKVLLPMSDKNKILIEYLEGKIKDIKQTGYISGATLEKEIDKLLFKNNTLERRENTIKIIRDRLLSVGKFSSYISKSQYRHTSMQTLVRDSDDHFLFHVYLKNHINEIFDGVDEDEIDTAIFKRFDNMRNLRVHQRANNDLIQIGFIRFHTEENSCFVNTIQSDVSYGLKLKDETFGVEALTDLYKSMITLVFERFLPYLHSIGITNIVIPTSTTRHLLFSGSVQDDMHNAGFTWGYDEMTKLHGFKKVKFGDTIWKKYINNDLYNSNVWTREKLNEKLDKKGKTSLNENFQMAEKEYIKTGKLSPEEIELVLDITKKDSTTKFFCDMMFNYIKPLHVERGIDFEDNKENIIDYMIDEHKNLLDYKSTLFPIKDFNMLNCTRDVAESLHMRKSILNLFKVSFPSVALRNFTDKKLERDSAEFSELAQQLIEFEEIYQEAEKKDVLTNINIDKIFRSGNGIKEWSKILKNILSTEVLDYHLSDEEDIERMLKNSDIKKLYESKGWYLFEIRNPNDLLIFGCDSRWCFSQKGYDLEDRENYFFSYSHNDVMYGLIDLNFSFNMLRFVITSPFLTKSGKFVGWEDVPTERLKEYGFEPEGYDDDNGSTFYDEDDKNLSNGVAKQVWKLFLSKFDSTTQNKIKSEMIDWGKDYFI